MILEELAPDLTIDVARKVGNDSSIRRFKIVVCSNLRDNVCEALFLILQLRMSTKIVGRSVYCVDC